jgi:hypothetical protein
MKVKMMMKTRTEMIQTMSQLRWTDRKTGGFRNKTVCLQSFLLTPSRWLAIANEKIVETGEEAEETVFSCRAKLYHFEGKEWKERGVGTFKINTAWAPSSEESSDRKSRLIMRTDGVHRVVLNTPIFRGMKVGNADGDAPTGKTLNVTGIEGGKPTLFALKVGFSLLAVCWWSKVVTC